MIPRDEARRYAQLLRQVVELSGVSEREVERRLALGGGTLSRIFGGRIELKLAHLLAILAVVGIKPERFFQLAAVVLEGTAEESLGRQVLAVLGRLAAPGSAPGPGRGEAAEPPLTDEDLDRRIDAALARLGVSPSATAPPGPRAATPPATHSARASRPPGAPRTAPRSTPPRASRPKLVAARPRPLGTRPQPPKLRAARPRPAASRPKPPSLRAARPKPPGPRRRGQ